MKGNSASEIRPVQIVTITTDELKNLLKDAALEALSTRDQDAPMSVKDVAAYLRFSEDTVKRLYRDEKLKGWKYPGGKNIFFNKKDVVQYWKFHYNDAE